MQLGPLVQMCEWIFGGDIYKYAVASHLITTIKLGVKRLNFKKIERNNVWTLLIPKSVTRMCVGGWSIIDLEIFWTFMHVFRAKMEILLKVHFIRAEMFSFCSKGVYSFLGSSPICKCRLINYRINNRSPPTTSPNIIIILMFKSACGGDVRDIDGHQWQVGGWCKWSMSSWYWSKAQYYRCGGDIGSSILGL